MLASARADTLFQFTQDTCTGTCGTGPFGTVQLTQLTPLSVRVLTTLGPNSRFAGTGAGEALTFSISGAKTVTIDSLTTNFAVGPGNIKVNGALGTFEYSVSCTTCQGGSASNPAGPLSFRVSSTSGLLLSDFIANSKGFYFASDIVGNNGNTGNVGSQAGSYYAPTPEPATLCMTGAAAVLLALLRRRLKGEASV
ncbi:MAG: PEP-CTERM sorting domain-containing protein [Bryobacteraceae bacterium]|nr:PEP-CTERM sorting domain-containing protein [Bryobacteraceae bacterium]